MKLVQFQLWVAVRVRKTHVPMFLFHHCLYNNSSAIYRRESFDDFPNTDNSTGVVNHFA